MMMKMMMVSVVAAAFDLEGLCSMALEHLQAGEDGAAAHWGVPGSSEQELQCRREAQSHSCCCWSAVWTSALNQGRVFSVLSEEGQRHWLKPRGESGALNAFSSSPLVTLFT